MDKFQPIPFEDVLKEALKDPEVKKGYDALELEYSIIEQVIRKRLQKGMSQKQLADKIVLGLAGGLSKNKNTANGFKNFLAKTIKLYN